MYTIFIAAMSPTNSDDATSKAVIVRIALFFYLFAATIAAGTASYILLNNYESKLQYADYDSKVHSYGTHILNNLYLSAMTSKLLMEAASFGCPHADMWPNCSALSMEYYSNFTKVLVDISKKNSISINPIITKEQIGGFESFAYDYFDQQGYGVDGPHYTLGMSSGLGKGIFARNSSGLYKSVDYYPYGENEILAPVFLASNLEVNRNAVMFNVYSETLRVRAIDNLLRCVHESGSHIDCAAITGIIDLIQMDGYSPAALVFSPITPYHNESTVVALVVAVFNWENMLNDKKSSLSNVVVILNYLDVSYTFCIMSGIATLLGRGDLHDQAFNEYREEFKVDSFPATDESYVIQVYPTAAYTDSNRSDAPVYGSVLVVSLIVFTSAFVYLYDRVINKITRERQIVLETKRMFVRYISHEIRTPLNTVKIGLSLLKRELHQLIASLKVITDKDMKMAGEMFNKINKETLASANYWVELIKDISVSSDVAVTVLNDLINYDKIVMGSIQLEISMVGIWELVIEITKPFYVHAKEKNIGFKVQSSGGVLEIFGDDWRGGKVDSSIRKSKNQLKSWPAHAADSVSSEQSISSSIHGRFSYGMDDTISRKVVLIPDGNSGMPPNMFNILTSLTIAADKTKIGQVIRNLVSNALKFTTSGDVTIAGSVRYNV